MSRGWANASRIARSVISLKVTRRVFSDGHVRRLGDVPGDRLALAVEVGREVDRVGALGRLGDLGDLLAAVVGDDVLGREVVVDVDAELALAGVLGQVADMAVGGEDTVVVAQVALDRPRLRRRLDDHQVLGHGRECSTGSCTDPCRATDARSASAASRATAASDLADAAEEVLVDLELGVVVVGRGRPAARARRRRRRPALASAAPCRRPPAAGSR